MAVKILARVLQKRLQMLADRTLQETQSGFRIGRSTTNTVLTLRQLEEKCMGHPTKKKKPLFIDFFDLTKAFDT